MSVIIGPTSNFGVELSNEIACCGLLVRLNDFSDTLQKSVDILFGRFNQQFSVVFAEMLSEKVKAVLDVRDERFLLGERQSTFFHELLHERLDLAFQDLFRLTSNDEIISKTNKIDLLVPSFARVFWEFLPQIP